MPCWLRIQIDPHIVFQNMQRQLGTKKGAAVLTVKLIVKRDFSTQVVPGFFRQDMHCIQPETDNPDRTSFAISRKLIQRARLHPACIRYFPRQHMYHFPIACHRFYQNAAMRDPNRVMQAFTYKLAKPSFAHAQNNITFLDQRLVFLRQEARCRRKAIFRMATP